MIIVWSWQRSGIGEGEWRLSSASQANDRLICKDVLANDLAMSYLSEQLNQAREEGDDLMVFLHRHHGYHQEHLKALLQQTNLEDDTTFKCFLFGEGADPIYLTNQPRGLLGTSGTFSAEVMLSGESLSLSAVASAERKELVTANFNYVWDTYQLALRRQFFELKEDLLSTLAQFLNTDQFAPGEVYSILSRPEHRILLLRLLSFAGRVRKNSGLATEIRTFEKNNNRTLTFDNCHMHLESVYGATAADTYTSVVSFISQHLLATGEPLSLLALRSRFDELLTLLPGRTYNS